MYSDMYMNIHTHTLYACTLCVHLQVHIYEAYCLDFISNVDSRNMPHFVNWKKTLYPWQNIIINIFINNFIKLHEFDLFQFLIQSS